jgi:hypothetical protein
MKYHYITDIQLIKDIKENFPLLIETRVDCYRMKQYFEIDSETIAMVNCFMPTEFYYQMKGNKIMKSINEILNNSETKKDLTIAETLKGLQSNNQSIESKIEQRKSIAASNVALNIEKIASVESMRKQISDQSGLISNSINLTRDIYSEIGVLAKTIDSYQKVVIENNAILIDIQKRLCNITSVNDIKITDKRQKIVENNMPIERQNKLVQVQTNGIDYHKFYKTFMQEFGYNFMNTKKLEHFSEFKGLIDNIDYTDNSTIEKSMSEYWTNQRENRGVYLWAAKLKKQVIPAMIKTIDIMQSNVQGNEMNLTNNIIPSEVKDKNYWIKFYGMSSNHMDDLIDNLQGKTFDKESINKIDSHIKQVSTIDRKSNNQFYQWLNIKQS